MLRIHRDLRDDLDDEPGFEDRNIDRLAAAAAAAAAAAEGDREGAAVEDGGSQSV